MPRFAVHARTGKWSGVVLNVTARDADDARAMADRLVVVDEVTCREPKRPIGTSDQMRLRLVVER
jgi:hypothetical protein